MAFIRIDKYTAKALEKGLGTAIRAGDIRFRGDGPDGKKNTSDDLIVGAVAYCVPDNGDSGPGTITKFFYDCAAPNPERVMFENIHTTGDAQSEAFAWVEYQTGITLSSLRSACPV